MARSDHDESPRSSRRSRKNSRNIPPPAPEVSDFYQSAADEELESPRRWRRSEKDWDVDRSRRRDGDWDPRQDDDLLLRTPESRASSSSYHASHRHHYHESRSRRDRSTTPSQSGASSMTSVLTPHPPRSSVTRPSTGNAVYRRPSVSMREISSAGYDEDISRGTRRSHSQTRSIHAVPSAPSVPLSRRTSRTLRSASVSSFNSDHEGDEELYEDGHDDSREPRSYRETRLVRVNREERSRSRADTRVSYRPSRRQESVRPKEEDYDEIDSRHALSLDELLPVRLRSRPASRSRSRPASVRQISDPESDRDHDADSDEPPPHDPRDRFDRRKSRKHQHTSLTPREHGRSRSENPPQRTSPSKRSSKIYHESEALSADRQDRRRPPSSSLRRPNNGSGSVAASQHKSVSSSTKHSSTFLRNFFGSSLPGYSHHHAPEKPVTLYPCLVCMDERPRRSIVKLKCGHRMCYSCLKRSFKLSITDPQHMPPKCCTADHIPLKHVERLFDISFKKTWNKKLAEYTARHPIYCPKASCGEFIRSQDIRYTNDRRKYGKCSKCSTRVCVQCSGKLHRERECPKDEETIRLLAQAKEEGWQRCYKCKFVVELQAGCNHMTCRCGAQFCYVCGGKWKTCSCPWFNYETAESDRLQHMQVPVRDRFGGRPTVDMPPSPRRESRHGLRSRPQTYEGEVFLRRLQEEQDEVLARRMHNYRDLDDAREEDFLSGLGDINGIGNAAGHFMNEDFRPRPRSIVVPQPPLAPQPPKISLEHAPMFERPQAGDYVRGVNRARGVRANSLTRLADRFNSDLRSSQNHRMPPTLQTSATMPLPTMTPALAPGPQIRRHVGVESGSGSGELGVRSMERPSGRITRMVVYDEPEEMALPMGMPGRKQQHVKDSPTTPTQSAMAGLTGDERYRGRVEEWIKYVSEGEPTAEVGYSG